jgi:hypothetical protein
MLAFLPNPGLDALQGGIQLLDPREQFPQYPPLHLGQPSRQGLPQGCLFALQFSLSSLG